MIKAIIFDWGGVICYPITKRLVARLKEQFNADERAIRKAYFKDLHDYEIGKLTDKEFWQNFCRELNIKIDENLVMDIVKDVEQLDKEVYQLLVQLKKTKRYKLVLLSNNIPVMVNYIRKKFDLSVFDNLFFSNEIGMRKPHLDIFEHVLKEINSNKEDKTITKILPEETIFIDDKQENLDTAAQLKIKTILFQNAEQLKKDLIVLEVKI